MAHSPDSTIKESDAPETIEPHIGRKLTHLPSPLLFEFSSGPIEMIPPEEPDTVLTGRPIRRREVFDVTDMPEDLLAALRAAEMASRHADLDNLLEDE